MMDENKKLKKKHKQGKSQFLGNTKIPFWQTIKINGVIFVYCEKPIEMPNSMEISLHVVSVFYFNVFCI